MDNGLDAHSAATLGAWLLLQILTAPHAMLSPPPAMDDEDEVDAFTDLVQTLGQPVEDPLAIVHSGL